MNGIQCNTYDVWMENGRRNGYNAVWAPLRRDLAEKFNVTAAWEFFDAHKGVDYGWQIVLMGLLDTRYPVSIYNVVMVSRINYPFPRCSKPTRESRVSELVVYCQCAFRRRREHEQ